MSFCGELRLGPLSTFKPRNPMSKYCKLRKKSCPCAGHTRKFEPQNQKKNILCIKFFKNLWRNIKIPSISEFLERSICLTTIQKAQNLAKLQQISAIYSPHIGCTRIFGVQNWHKKCEKAWDFTETQLKKKEHNVQVTQCLSR